MDSLELIRPQEAQPAGLDESRTHASALLRSLDAPLVVTQNGRAAVVLLPPELFEEMREQIRYLQQVTEGLADANAGQLVDHAKLAEHLQSWGQDKQRQDQE